MKSTCCLTYDNSTYKLLLREVIRLDVCVCLYGHDSDAFLKEYRETFHALVTR